jgi:hypothetical protein
MRGSNTHDVSIDRARGIVVKKLRSQDHGEPAREWAALTLLARHAPGLAPARLRADLDAAPATIEMTWLPGAELGGPTLTSAQTQALATALVISPVPTGIPGHGTQCRQAGSQGPQHDGRRTRDGQ